MSAGGALVQPSNQIFQTYNANLFYRRQLSTASFTYSRSITPSFTASTGALASDVMSVGVSHRLGALLTGGASATYARNEFVTSTKQNFSSYMGTTFLAYRAAPWMVTSLNYSYSFFDQDIVTSRNTFSQQIVMINLVIGAPAALLGAGGVSGMYR